MPRRRLRLSWSHGPWIDYSKYLPPGEEIKFNVQKHGAVLLWPFAQAVLALIVYVTFYNQLGLSSESPIDIIMFIVTLAFWLRASWLLFEWIKIERVIVTNKRIVEVSGFIVRRVASMHLSKVTDLTYRRGPMEWAFNYGELILESAGQKQALESISYIPHPDKFYRDFMELLNEALGGGDPTEPPGGGGGDDDTDTGEIPRVKL